MAVSATTRPPRPGEVDGVDYHFLAEPDFARRVASGDFLEHVTYAGRRYGTLRSEVERHLDAGCSVVLELELRGARAVRQALPGATAIFIAPPSLDELGRRLARRGTDTDADIAERLRVGAQELAGRGDFDRLIVNADVATATDELAGVLAEALSG